VLCAYCVKLARLVQVTVRDCVKAWCYTLERRRRIWRSVRRYHVFCRVELECYVPLRILVEDNKEDKELVDVTPGWG
jgi:hypothetical protein